MNKQLTMILIFLVAHQNMVAYAPKANMRNSKKIVYQCGALITACIALPLSALFFYRGMKAFDERKAITESIPGFEERIKILLKTCAEFNDPEDCDKYLAIHWTNLYDIFVREYDPQLADKLLDLRRREAYNMIPGFLLAIVGIITGVAALSD